VAKVRFCGPEPHMVPWLGGRTVQPDEVVEVPDKDFAAYVCQPALWQGVEEPKPAAEAAPKAARGRGGKAGE
jgi:hypothetical protein